MPKFYRICEQWVLTYRLWAPQRSASLSALRVSRDGLSWSERIVIGDDPNYNNGPSLVRVNDRVIAFNHRYPDRQTITRKVLDPSVLVDPGSSDSDKEK